MFQGTLSGRVSILMHYPGFTLTRQVSHCSLHIFTITVLACIERSEFEGKSLLSCSYLCYDFSSFCRAYRQGGLVYPRIQKTLPSYLFMWRFEETRRAEGIILSDLWSSRRVKRISVLLGGQDICMLQCCLEPVKDLWSFYCILDSTNIADISKKCQRILTLKGDHPCGKITLTHMISQSESNWALDS